MFGAVWCGYLRWSCMIFWCYHIYFDFWYVVLYILMWSCIFWCGHVYFDVVIYILMWSCIFDVIMYIFFWCDHVYFDVVTYILNWSNSLWVHYNSLRLHFSQLRVHFIAQRDHEFLLWTWTSCTSAQIVHFTALNILCMHDLLLEIILLL